MENGTTDDGNVISIGGDNPLDDSWPSPQGDPGSTVTIGGDPTGLFGEPTTDPGEVPRVVTIGGDQTGIFPSAQPGVPGTFVIGGDPNDFFPQADPAQPDAPGSAVIGNPWGPEPVPTGNQPDAPGSAVIGNPWGPEPVPTGNQPDAPGSAVIGNPWGELPSTFDPMTFGQVQEGIDVRDAVDTWAALRPGQPIPVGADGQPLPPVQIYYELMTTAQDQATIDGLQARIDAINARITGIINNTQ